MANSQAFCASAKQDLLNGIHAFGPTVTRGATTADTFKAALYLTSGSLGSATTAYSATSEVSGAGYTAGGLVVPNAAAPASSGTTAYWTPSAALVYSNVTLATPFDTVLIYNASQSNKSVSVHTFGAQTITAGVFSLTMPVNAAGTALLQLA